MRGIVKETNPEKIERENTWNEKEKKCRTDNSLQFPKRSLFLKRFRVNKKHVHDGVLCSHVKDKCLQCS